MSIGLFQVRSHEVVRQYEEHYMHDADHSPCPCCEQGWSEPSPRDGSRTLQHLPKCDFIAWLHEPDDD